MQDTTASAANPDASVPKTKAAPGKKQSWPPTKPPAPAQRAAATPNPLDRVLRSPRLIFEDPAVEEDKFAHPALEEVDQATAWRAAGP